MDMFLLWSHPLIQSLAFILGLWAMWQGGKRFAMQYRKKILFPWKSHVRVGTAALVLWTAGALGFYVTHTVFGLTHITGLHADLTWWIVALSLLGLLSGFILNRYKKKRKVLPLVHGIINVVLLILVIIECWTGVELLEYFVPL